MQLTEGRFFKLVQSILSYQILGIIQVQSVVALPPLICFVKRVNEILKMCEDEIVEEVRKYRDDHASKFCYDLRKIYKDLKDKDEKCKTGVCKQCGTRCYAAKVLKTIAKDVEKQSEKYLYLCTHYELYISID